MVKLTVIDPSKIKREDLDALTREIQECLYFEEGKWNPNKEISSSADIVDHLYNRFHELGLVPKTQVKPFKSQVTGSA